MQKESGPVSLNSQTVVLPPELQAAVDDTLRNWRTNKLIEKLWAGDPKLWTNHDENKWVGWLQIASDQLANINRFNQLADEVKTAGFTHALLLGMGGSSLCPEVLSKTFGHIDGYPELHVLDSTDPAQVKTRQQQIDVARTLFIVSSKSGGTLEPNIFKQYFFERTRESVGDEPGQHFMAITDPGSKMQQVAEADKFRHVLFGLPSIGGRYSALSDFGMAPAAVIGIDVKTFLTRAQEMVDACSAEHLGNDNPGLLLGATLGTLAGAPFKRDKVTIISSPGIYDLGAWLEQLLAESTGKDGKGLIPVDRERLGPPQVYGNDRVFVHLQLETEGDSEQKAALDALQRAGHPVIRIAVRETYNLGQEFFRWEIATAVAGAILKVNPFDQPDVEASKIATRELTSAYEATGSLPEEKPFHDENGLKLFTDDKNLQQLILPESENASLESYLKAHLDRINAGDYFALLAYIEMNDEHESALQEIRHAVRDQKRVATCLGFGPRFLHSTGQAYKGGPPSGVFLQITCDDANDLQVPDQKYTFGIVKAAQARGDFKVLTDRNRRALRVHLGADVRAGLERLSAAMMKALGHELGQAIWQDTN